jgi:hypothetical protein
MKVTNIDCQVKVTISYKRLPFPEKVIMRHNEKGTAGICIFEQ